MLWQPACGQGGYWGGIRLGLWALAPVPFCRWGPYWLGSACPAYPRPVRMAVLARPLWPVHVHTDPGHTHWPVRVYVAFLDPANAQGGSGLRERALTHLQRPRQCRCRLRSAILGRSQEHVGINMLFWHPGVLRRGSQPQGGQGAWYISRWGC